MDQYTIMFIIVLFVILVSIQYTLNKILVGVNEMVKLLHLLVNRQG